jgi:hypothetical protein
MEYLGAVAVTVFASAVGALLVARWRVRWRLAMLVPSLGAFVVCLLVLAAVDSLSWPAVGLCLAVAVVFYAGMLVTWHFYDAARPPSRPESRLPW